jgi:mevalonate kinase
VSTPHLNHLISRARAAGAAGAKLSGGGGGGNIIALVQADGAEAVAKALLAAGARRVITTEIGGEEISFG